MDDLLPSAIPFWGTIEILKRCNSRCSYCNNWKENASQRISAADCQELFPQLTSLGVQRLIITGGEPLLHPELDMILKLAVSSKIYTSLITNGLLLSSARFDALVKAGLQGITLSLDTLDAEIYYKHRGVKLQNPLKKLQLISEYAHRFNLSASVNCVLSSLNSKGLENLINTANDLELPVMIQPCITDNQPQLQYLVPAGQELPNVKRNLQKVIEIKENGFRILSSSEFLTNIYEYWSKGCVQPITKCEYGFINLTINHLGDVLPCWRLPAIGNIHTASVVELWNSSEMQNWRLRMLAGKCPGCWLSCSFDWQSTLKSEKYCVEQWRSNLSNPQVINT